MFTLWIRTSKDKYELPIAVADTAEELAVMCRRIGVAPNATANSIRSGIAHKSPYLHKIKYEGNLWEEMGSK